MLNIPNLDKLIAHLEAQPPERINMAFWTTERTGCGCYIAHGREVFPYEGIEAIGLPTRLYEKLFNPPGHYDERYGVKRYPAHRVIATLKRLCDHYLATGEVVVDWGPEPTAGEPWAAPQAIELTPPALPAEITRLLSAPSDTTESAGVAGEAVNG